MCIYVVIITRLYDVLILHEGDLCLGAACFFPVHKLLAVPAIRPAYIIILLYLCCIYERYTHTHTIDCNNYCYR